MRTKQFIRPAKDDTIFSTRNMKFKSTSCLGFFRTCAGNRSKNKGRSIVKATLSEYVRKSTIHGMAYVGDDKGNKFERLGWLVMIICSVIGASYSIYQAYRTMKDNPIIETPSLSRTPRWEIPFPAVTVCPISTFGWEDFGTNITNWPDSIKNLLPNNRTDQASMSIDEVKYIESLFLWKSDQNNFDILTQVLPKMKIEFAGLGNPESSLNVPGRKMITDDGACVTFNMYPEKALYRDGVILSAIDDATYSTERYWSRDTGFSKNLPQLNTTLPLRSFSIKDIFHVSLSVNDSERLLNFASKFTVNFHAPDELPQINRRFKEIIIESDSGSMIFIEPHLVVSEGIEHYQPEVRQCYYYDERQLAFYKGYTQSNCETECFTNFTLARCNCVPYHLPHFNDTKLCLEEYECSNFLLYDFFAPDFTDDDLRSPSDKCNCFPSCTQLLYRSVLGETQHIKNQNIFFVLYDKEIRHIKKYVRTELHSISEFLSNCGGALGLFLGVSIFSIIELVYFCTVRLYSHTKKRPAVNSSE